MLKYALISFGLVTLIASADAAPRHCPPGLAKKEPACIPPGLARSGLTAEDLPFWIGDIVDPETAIPVDDIEELPLLGPNEDWVRIGDIILRIDTETYEVLDLIRATFEVLD